MSGKFRVACFTLSLDGYGAGPDQSLSEPMGLGGENLHAWFVPTLTFHSMIGKSGGDLGLDDDFAARGIENLGAWILGRNMFGPIRGDWGDEDWKGWWGDNPPYHVPVIVLTRHPRASIEMEGGTVFHFETGGIEIALERARAFAAGKDVRLGGGVQTVHQYLKAGLLDELHLAISPILLGRGEAFWEGIDLPALGYEVSSTTRSERATHVVIRRAGGEG